MGDAEPEIFPVVPAYGDQLTLWSHHMVRSRQQTAICPFFMKAIASHAAMHVSMIVGARVARVGAAGPVDFE